MSRNEKIGNQVSPGAAFRSIFPEDLSGQKGTVGVYGIELNTERFEYRTEVPATLEEWCNLRKHNVTND
jgi:hypothetical protein